MAGCAIGLVVGVWLRELLIAFAPADVPRLENAGIDWRVVIFAAVLSVLTAVFFGLAPAFRASSVRPQEALTSASNRVTGGAVMGWKNALLVGEVALSLILLTGGALLLKSFIRLNATELGFSTDHVLAMQIPLPNATYSSQQRVAFFEELTERVRGLAGVDAAGYANRLPMRGGWGGGVQFPGEPANIYHETEKQAVSPGYFEVLRLPLRRGRLLTPADREGAALVAVVTETFAKKLLSGVDPIGARFRNGLKSPWVQIVGVVGDMRRDGKASRVAPHVFYSALQTSTYPVEIADFAFRTVADPEALVAMIQQHVWSMDKDQPVARIRRMDDLVVESKSTRRFQTTLVLLFAGLAVMLAVIGVYGVASYSVTQRSRELGIRAALGAQRRDILRLVLRQSAGLSILGVIIGLAGALAFSRYIESMLYEVKPNDAATYALAGTLLLTIALAASFLPARRAAHADPMEVLRYH
jgi:predicted permease